MMCALIAFVACAAFKHLKGADSDLPGFTTYRLKIRLLFRLNWKRVVRRAFHGHLSYISKNLSKICQNPGNVYRLARRRVLRLRPRRLRAADFFRAFFFPRRRMRLNSNFSPAARSALRIPRSSLGFFATSVLMRRIFTLRWAW